MAIAFRRIGSGPFHCDGSWEFTLLQQEIFSCHPAAGALVDRLVALDGPGSGGLAVMCKSPGLTNPKSQDRTKEAMTYAG
jgi:hypothetical protein